MDELSHLSDRFKNKFGLGRATQSGPPQQWAGPSNPPSEVPQYTPRYDAPSPRPPPVPPRPDLTQANLSRPQPPLVPNASRPRPTPAPAASLAGSLFSPGTYPTPELPLYPLAKFLVLEPASLESYNAATIQQALDDLGPSSTLYLPPRTLWKLEKPIILQNYQEIATQGYPSSEGDMAVLDAQEECHPHLIHALDKSGIRIRNLVFEGNKEKYGWDKEGGVMLQLGGGRAHNQVVDRCVIRNPRHWSCIQAFDGSHNVRITNNRIGPAGVGWDLEQFRWADGISYAGLDGLVAGNLIIDATDGAIVVFGAAGTLITSNTIVTQRSLGLGAINMVDYMGEVDYSFTRVTHNTIVTAGTMLKIGVGQGKSVWWKPDQRQVNRGAVVSHNLITRNLAHIHSANPSPSDAQLGEGTIGYGFPVGSDIADWTCRDNVSDDNVIYSGDISGTLPSYLNAPPGPFVHDKYGMAQGDEADESNLRLQPEFVEGKICGILDIRPGPSKVLAYEGGRFVLRRGEKRSLNGVDIVFGNDGELTVYQMESDGARNGRIVWEAGIRGFIDPSVLHRAVLFLTPSGKLLVADAANQDIVYFDLTPHIPFEPLPPSGRPNSSKLILSSDKPFITITSSTGNLLYACSYSVRRGMEFPIGRYVARATPGSPRGVAIIYTLSPQRQIIVAHARGEIPHHLPWPVTNPENYEVVRNIGDGKTDGVDDMKARVSFQGDGHLLIFDGDGHDLWGSGTHDSPDRPGAAELCFGTGTEAAPYLELVDASGKRLWSA